MPRHDRAYGEHHQPGRGGGTKRRTRAPKNTYAAKQHRKHGNDRRGNDLETFAAQVFGSQTPVDMGRHGGSSSGSSTPQKPKPQPKGGSKPGGTIRREVRRARSAS